MWVGHCINCQKSVHRIKNVVHMSTEPVKCLMNGILLKGPPKLIADFITFPG